MAAKRKRVVVTLKEKLRALERLDGGESVTNIANELGVGITTVKDWKKNRSCLETFSAKCYSDQMIALRSTVKKGKYEDLDEALWVWYSQEKNNGTAISVPMLREKAIQLNHEKTGKKNFTASEGWLARWRKRHGIYGVGRNSKKLFTGVAAASNFEDENDYKPFINDPEDWVNDSDELDVVNENKIKNEIPDVRDVVIENKISHADGRNALDVALKYIEQQEETTYTDILVLKKWIGIAATKEINGIKQEKIDDFYSQD